MTNSTDLAGKKPNVLVFGLGAIGSIYACILKLSGRCSVTVVARSGYEQVKANGIKLKSEKFGNHESIRFDAVYRTCVEAAQSGTTYEYIMIATKALLDSKPSIQDLIRPVVTPGSTAITLLQNGVGAEDPLHLSFPENTIISAVVWTGGKVLGQGHIEQFNRESLTIGVDWRSPEDDKTKIEEEERLTELVGILQAGGGSCDVVSSIQLERWTKVMWNACWNSLTTAISAKTGILFAATPHAITLCQNLMGEVQAVARAKGLPIPDGTVNRLIKQCTDVPGGLPSSMMFDALAGRPTEVEVILGTPLSEGTRLGVPTPTLLTVYTIVKAIDYRNSHPEEAKM